MQAIEQREFRRKVLEECAQQLEKEGEQNAADFIRTEIMDSAVADFFPPLGYVDAR